MLVDVLLGPVICITESITWSMATQCEFGVLMTRGFVWEPLLSGVAGVPSSTHESIVPVYKLCYILSVLWAGWRDSRISPVANVTWGP